MTPFQILGLAATATLVEAEQAYRRLRTKAHPDHGGTDEQFRQVQRAWEAIQKGWRPGKETQAAPPRRHPPKQTAQPTQPKPRTTDLDAWQLSPTEFVVQPTITQAFNGFTVRIQDKNLRLSMPPGVPHNLRTEITINGKPTGFFLTVRFMRSIFTFADYNTAKRDSQLHNGVRHDVGLTGDLRLTHTINSLNNREFTIDGLDKKIKVRPAFGRSFSDGERLVFPGAGYYNWSTSTASKLTRGDLHVTIYVSDIVPMNDFS